MVTSRSDLPAELFAAATREEFRRAIGQVDPMSLSAREVAQVAKLVTKGRVAATARVALCGTQTFDPLPTFLRAHGGFLDMEVVTYSAAYGQYMQELLTEGSGLNRFDPQVLLVSCALRQIAPRLHDDFSELSAAELAAEKARLLSHIDEIATAAAARTQAIVLIANFPRPASPALGVADAKQSLGEMEFYLELNLELIRRFRDSDRVHVFDLDRLVGGMRSDATDRHFFMAKRPWSDAALHPIARELMRYVVAGTGRTRKCLVVDLDNTLWGGVIGEDGPEGIRIGQGSPAGEAFDSMQRAVCSLRNRGIVLAVCSKNNQEDVESAFSTRPDMPLKWEHFVAAEVGWQDKATGLREVAASLGIGLESLVFADDNPAERAIVRGALPEVTVLELPDDVAEYASFLKHQAHFEKLRISPDDALRAADYASKRKRERLLADAGDLGKYLASLGTRMTVRPVTAADLPRVHELFNKTNQFNLTTKRRQLADLKGFLESADSRLGLVTAEDRFGNMGTVGVYLLLRRGEAAFLDSFLLSCRVLGRDVETGLMNCVKREVAESLSCLSLEAEFIPTAKNAPAAGFLEREGFILLERDAAGVASYRAEGPALAERPCSHLRVDHQLGKT